jgi:hypothetical protein
MSIGAGQSCCRPSGCLLATRPPADPSLAPATPISHIELEAVVFDEITLFERKVPWRHLVHENLTGFKEMFISSDTFSMAHRLPHRVGGRVFREAADDV